MKRAIILSILVSVILLGQAFVDGADDSNSKLLEQIRELKSQLAAKDKELIKLRSDMIEQQKNYLELQSSYNEIASYERQKKLAEIAARNAHRQQLKEVQRSYHRAEMLEKYRKIDNYFIPSRPNYVVVHPHRYSRYRYPY